MSDYISRVQAIEEINKYRMTSGVSNQGTWNECVDVIAHTVSELPSADVKENIKGEWIAQDIHNCCTEFKCSKCGYLHNFMHLYGEPTADYTFCPNCGADMRGE